MDIAVIDIWLLVLIVIVGIVVAIEGIPDGFEKKAKAFVAVLIAAVVRFGHHIGQRFGQLRPLPDTGIKWTIPTPSRRVAIGAAVAVVASPIAAIPMTIVFALLLYALNMIGGDEYDLVRNGSGTLRYILGYAFVILVATLDVISRWFIIALPFFVGLGFIAASYASRSDRFIKRLALSTLMMGGVYPLVFMLAAARDAFSGPIFN